MGVETLTDTATGKTCMFCNTTDTAFGPVFTDAIEAEEFLDWLSPLDMDPRDIREDKLVNLYHSFQENGSDSDVRLHAAGVK